MRKIDREVTFNCVFVALHTKKLAMFLIIICNLLSYLYGINLSLYNLSVSIWSDHVHFLYQDIARIHSGKFHGGGGEGKGYKSRGCNPIPNIEKDNCQGGGKKAPPLKWILISSFPCINQVRECIVIFCYIYLIWLYSTQLRIQP